MLLFLIGLAITILGAVLLLNTLNVVFLLVFAFGLFVTTISAFQPLSGWGTPKTIEEYDLIPIIPNTNIYIVQDRRGNIMYKYADEVVRIIKYQDYAHVKLNKLTKGEKPVLKKSKVKPKRTLWAFPILSDKYIDVLCVPENGIVK